MRKLKALPEKWLHFSFCASLLLLPGCSDLRLPPKFQRRRRHSRESQRRLPDWKLDSPKIICSMIFLII